MESIYIEALKKGYEAGDGGISYWEIVEHIDKLKLTDVSKFGFHQYFYVWFFDNFYLGANYVDRRQNRMGLDPKQTAANQPVNPALWFSIKWLSGHYGHGDDNGKENGQLDEKAIMMFEARQKYLDYLSMKENSRKSDQANELSKNAVNLTRIGIALTFLLGILTLYYTVKPPTKKSNHHQHRGRHQCEMRHKCQRPVLPHKHGQPTLTDTTADSIRK